jgi:hypothetical protein
MKLRFKAPGVVLLLGSILSVASARTSFDDQREGIERAQDRALTGVAATVRSTIDRESRRAIAFADLVSVRHSVAAGIRAGDRDTMFTDIGPTWERLRGNYGVDGLSFIAMPGVTFLRMHDRGHFGDDLASRPMIMTTLGRGESQSGIEVGRSGAKIRGVSQVTDPDGVVGAVEVGIPFAPVLEEIQSLSNFELAAYLKQVGPPPSDARMIDGYRELATTNRRLIKAVTNAEDMDGVQDVRTEYRLVRGRRFGVVRMPLPDFSGTNIGVIIATRDFGEYQREERAAFRLAMTHAITQIVLLAGIVLLVFNGLVLRPFSRLAASLELGTVPDEELTKRSDEVGELARAIAAKANGGNS